MSLSLFACFVAATIAVQTLAEDAAASSASDAQAVQNDGFSVGDGVVSLIDWAGGNGNITRGDIGRAVAQGENDKLVVDFPHIKGLHIMLHQIGKVGAPLNGGFILGEKVVSLIDWEGGSGRVTKGDVGVALGKGVGNGVLCDFPNIKSLNIMVVQIRKASDETQPMPKVEPLRPAAASSQQLRKDPAPAAPLAAALDSVPVTVSPPAEAAATVAPVAAEASPATVAPLGAPSGASLAVAQAGAEAGASEVVPVTVAPLAGGENVPITVAPPGGAAASEASLAAVQGGASEAVPVTQAPPSVSESVPVTVAPSVAEGGDLAALQSLASSLSEKVAKAKEAGDAVAATSVQAEDSDTAGLEGLQALASSLGKKLEQAKANREDSEAALVASRDAVARHRSSILVADSQKPAAAPGVLQRLGSLLGKRRDAGTDGDGDATSFMQVDAEVDRRALLQKGRKRHEEL